jgi:hypothetical protein
VEVTGKLILHSVGSFMRKSLWVIFTLLFLVVVVPNAQADSYSYSFTGTGPCDGTSFTLIDTAGPLTVDGWNNLAPLLTSPTDLIANGLRSSQIAAAGSA